MTPQPRSHNGSFACPSPSAPARSPAPAPRHGGTERRVGQPRSAAKPPPLASPTALAVAQSSTSALRKPQPAAATDALLQAQAQQQQQQQAPQQAQAQAAPAPFTPAPQTLDQLLAVPGSGKSQPRTLTASTPHPTIPTVAIPRAAGRWGTRPLPPDTPTISESGGGGLGSRRAPPAALGGAGPVSSVPRLVQPWELPPWDGPGTGERAMLNPEALPAAGGADVAAQRLLRQAAQQTWRWRRRRC